MSLIQVSKGSDAFAAFEAALSLADLPATDLDADQARYSAFEHRDGEEAPTVIANCRKFSTTCPDTAVLMCLNLV